MAAAPLWGPGPVHLLFPREKCVLCPPQQLSCPSCPSGQVCVQVSETCDQCASRKCVDDGMSGATNSGPSSSSNGPNVGAIVGGVVGGLVFIAILTWLVWRFYLKPKRARWEEQYEGYSEKDSNGNYAGSSRTRASMASTAYTRASNVIQIAFIPGVTGRSDDTPVPPVPSSQPNSPYTDASGDHYFMPGDLRDSTYSGFTDDGASTRRSMARSIAPSIAPSLLRQSVASTVYHEATVQNPAPAQTAQRGRANMVSVKASGSNSRAPSIPAVPTVDREKYAALGVIDTPTTQSSEAQPKPVVPVINVVSDSASESGVSTRSGTTKVQSAIQDATRRASQEPTHGGLGSVTTRDPSPFSDANRISQESSNEETS